MELDGLDQRRPIKHPNTNSKIEKKQKYSNKNIEPEEWMKFGSFWTKLKKGKIIIFKIFQELHLGAQEDQELN